MLKRNYMLYVEKESSYKVDPTPTAADAVEAWDVEITPNRIVTERNQGSGVAGSRYAFVDSDYSTVKFKTYLAGNGTAAEATQPIVSKLLDSCGLVGAFADSKWTHGFSTTQGSVTLWFYMDGIKYVINGARCTFALNMNAGELPYVEWTGIGLYTTETAVSMLTPTSWNSIPLVCASEDFELGSGTNISGIETFTLKQNGLQFFKDINNAQGFGKSFITDLDIEGTFNPELTTALQTQFEGAVVASTTYASHIVHGSGTGEVITITMPGLQIMDWKPSDSNGLLRADCSFKLRNTVDGSANALSITIA